jgi:hypothetical protein
LSHANAKGKGIDSEGGLLGCFLGCFSLVKERKERKERKE